jgi:glyoxylase-like metal-dependent hydrolase (beta-lactamase superfamily II)
VSAKQQPLVTQANLKLASPRLRLIKAGAEVAPGVTTFDTAGHTPGHMSVHISSGREEMLLTGDVVVDTAISFLHPEWAFGFDLDVPLATKARMAFLDRAAADKTLVGSYHKATSVSLATNSAEGNSSDAFLPSLIPHRWSKWQ